MIRLNRLGAGQVSAVAALETQIARGLSLLNPPESLKVDGVLDSDDVYYFHEVVDAFADMDPPTAAALRELLPEAIIPTQSEAEAIAGEATQKLRSLIDLGAHEASAATSARGIVIGVGALLAVAVVGVTAGRRRRA